MRDPGIDARDELWLAHELEYPSDPLAGPCVATFNGTTLGVFPNAAAAEAAQNRRIAELAARGVDVLALNPEMTVTFVEIH